MKIKRIRALDVSENEDFYKYKKGMKKKFNIEAQKSTGLCR